MQFQLLVLPLVDICSIPWGSVILPIWTLGGTFVKGFQWVHVSQTDSLATAVRLFHNLGKLVPGISSLPMSQMGIYCSSISDINISSGIQGKK
jgi:hypothetical protein